MKTLLLSLMMSSTPMVTTTEALKAPNDQEQIVLQVQQNAQKVASLANGLQSEQAQDLVARVARGYAMMTTDSIASIANLQAEQTVSIKEAMLTPEYILESIDTGMELSTFAKYEVSHHVLFQFSKAIRYFNEDVSRKAQYELHGVTGIYSKLGNELTTQTTNFYRANNVLANVFEQAARHDVLSSMSLSEFVASAKNIVKLVRAEKDLTHTSFKLSKEIAIFSYKLTGDYDKAFTVQKSILLGLHRG